MAVNAQGRKSSFATDVLKLVSGTTVAQLIALLASPILTRLFSPAVWGVLAIFSSITGILGVVACLRYELSIMLPEKDDEAANLLGVSITFVIFVSLLSIPLIIWGHGLLFDYLNAPGLASYLWLVPLMVFIQGVFLALNYWNSRTKHFGRLSIAQIISTLATTAGKLGFGFAGYTSAATMIGATVAGSAISTAILGGQIWRDDREIFLKSIRWRKMGEGIRRHKKFPLLSTWSALMNTISVQLPPLMLAAFFTPTVVGFYALGHRLLSMPVSLIGGAIGQVFFQRAAEAQHQGMLPMVVKSTFVRLMTIGVYPLILILIIGKEIFCVIFGTQWTEAGLYAQILSPWILFVFLGSPISTLFSVLEMQGTGLLFNTILLITRVVSLVIGGLKGSILLALILYTTTGTILWCGFCFYLMYVSGVKLHDLSADCLKLMAMILLSLLPVVPLKFMGLEPIIIFIAGITSILLYYILLYLQDKEIQNLFVRYVRMYIIGKL